MTEDDIRPLLEADPFEPFTIHLAGNWSQDIDRPELVSFSPHGGALYLYHPDGQWKAVLSLDHVTGISHPAVPFIR